MILVIGDSLSALPYAYGYSWIEYVRNLGVNVQSVGVSGSAYRDWSTPSYFNPRVFQYPNVSTVFNMLGINDITGGGGSNIGTMTTQMNALKAMERAKWPSASIYTGTITPIGFAGGSPEEVLRQAFNALVEASPLPVDMARYVDPAQTSTWPTGLHIGDFIHPTSAGQLRLAQAFQMAVATYDERNGGALL